LATRSGLVGGILIDRVRESGANCSQAGNPPIAQDPSPPIISVFGGATFVPLAPGEAISIYGSGLAETFLAAPGPH